jgi:hypothetical protein
LRIKKIFLNGTYFSYRFCKRRDNTMSRRFSKAISLIIANLPPLFFVGKQE